MRNRRAALTAIAGAASLALTLTACGQNSDGGSKDTSGSTKGATIGISMPTKSSERWIGDGNNVVKDLESKGYKTKLAFGEDDPDTQVSQIENMITQGVKALIIAAIDNKSMNNVLQQAALVRMVVLHSGRSGSLQTRSAQGEAGLARRRTFRARGECCSRRARDRPRLCRRITTPATAAGAPPILHPEGAGGHPIPPSADL